MSAVSSGIWIADSTPLIVLAKINNLHLLPLLAGKVLIPQIVAEEVQAGQEGDPARAALSAGFGQIIPTPSIPSQIVAYHLDAGESGVLAAALSRTDSRVVLDDGKARTAALALGIPLIGTLGIIARARVAGDIPAAKPLIEMLRNVDFRADDALLNAILSRLGETWP